MTRPLFLALVLLLAATTARADAGLSAAAGKVEITPSLSGKPVWMAGFGTGRRAEDVHDPLFARAILLSDGSKTLALVALDLVGYFHPEVEAIRAQVARDARIDLVVVAATHTHHGPDTMGLWGMFPLVSGVDEDFMKSIREKVAALVVRLAGELQPVRIAFAQIDGPVEGFVRDSRDPVVIDNTLTALVVEGADGVGPIATVINWACHPETLWSKNPHITGDYCSALCRRVEEQGGGTAVFFSGALGGMMTPDTAKNEKGETQHTFEEATRIGYGVADRALAALKKAPRSAEAPIRIATRGIRVPIENPKYHLGMRTGALKRPVVDAEGKPIAGIPTRRVVAFVETDVCAFTIGPSVWATVPGELFPELAVGGYDGSRSFGKPVVGPNNTNPPDLKAAPAPPYLRDVMHAPFCFVLGLADDELGYIVPPYDFKWNDKSALLEPQPPGDHYEETNSTGIHAVEKILVPLEELIREVHGE